MDCVWVCVVGWLCLARGGCRDTPSCGCNARDVSGWCGVLGDVSSACVVDDAPETVAYWRERAQRAEGQVAELTGQVAELTGQVGELAEQVAVLGRMLFGQSSERTRPGQGRTKDDLTQTGRGGPQRPKPGRRRGQQPGSRGHGRRDYSHLTTREVLHDVPPDQRICACCGVEFEPLGSQASEQIDWEVEITRVVHRRLRYRRWCDCPGARTVTAPPAPNLTGKSRFTPGFAARLLYEKYVLGLPVHRIARALAAEGFDVAEGSLCGTLKAVAGLLVPLESAIVARNAQAGHAHADETSWRVFQPVEGKDSYRWWLWVFLTTDTVVFTMDPTRSTRVLERHFGIDRADGTLPPERRLVLVARTFTPRTSAWPGWTGWIPSGAGPTSAGTSSGPATPTTNSGTGGTSG